MSHYMREKQESSAKPNLEKEASSSLIQFGFSTNPFEGSEHYKKRLVSGIWFGIAGCLATLMIQTIVVKGSLGLFLFIPFLVSGFLGFYFGFEILLFSDEKRNLFKAMWYGFLGGLIALGIITIIYFGFVFTVMLVVSWLPDAHPQHISSQDVHMILDDVLNKAKGWLIILFGVIFAASFYLLRHLFLKLCDD